MTDNTELHPELSALDKRIAKAAQLKAKYEQEMQRIKSTKRTEETGKKVINGALIENAARENPRIREWYLKEVAEKVTRPHDLKRLAPLLEELRSLPKSV